ncbi:hypothetical protein HC928_12790 [bacterium]|nr:hypothetical protein [bacterium]
MSASWRVLRNAKSGAVVLERVRLCKSFWCHLKGLQLAPQLPDHEGLLFVTGDEGISTKAIHMLFMRFSIAVVWLDSGGRVVDKKLAKPWRLYYAPKTPARYYVEASVSLLDRVRVGDVLTFDDDVI